MHPHRALPLPASATRLPLGNGWLVRGAAVLVAFALIALFATLQGRGASAEAATLAAGDAPATEPMPFEKPGESFPGSAYYYLAVDSQSAQAGQPLDAGAHWDDEHQGAAAPATSPTNPGPAARAIAQAGSAIDRTRALSCLTAAVYYEAASEPDGGQRAVAQVVLNRMAHPAYPKTVCGVVYQGSERATGCQFTFTCDGSLARHPVQLFWKRAEDVARAALAGYVYTPVGLATHYHTFAVHPYWADSLAFIGQIGAHRFYRMAGPAGAPAAFRFTYAGGEPLDRPSAHLVSARNDPADRAMDPLAIERSYEARLKAVNGNADAVRMAAPIAYAAPAYTGEALQRGGDAAFRAQALPGANSTIRAEYQASGQWLKDPQ
jgi:spore germination cell wall hydrolase CwlJ-like protein